MGGAVSSGNDNNELVDNLMRETYIRSKKVELVFRALDRANYMTPDSYDQAYKDLAWRSGPLHLSSPCIYSEVMEGLVLYKGLSFLNIGSGTGYLSSMVGLILGSQGINHGVEVHPDVHEYAVSKLTTLLETSPVVDDFDFCPPKFFNANGLCLNPLKAGYDRVYCGAACPVEYESYFRKLLKVGGILVMPLDSKLVQIHRVTKNKWESRSLLNVTFAPLRVPTQEEAKKLINLDDHLPPRLEVLCRGAVRAALHAVVLQQNPDLRVRHVPRAPPPARSRTRRICIPVDAPAPHLAALHDLDPDGGADEMNALLNLVINMGHSRVAGALRYDHLDTDTDTDSEDTASDEELHTTEEETPPRRPDTRARRATRRNRTRRESSGSKKNRSGSKHKEEEDGPSGAEERTGRARRRPAAGDSAPSTSRTTHDAPKLSKRKDTKDKSKRSRRSPRTCEYSDNSKDEKETYSGVSEEDSPAQQTAKTEAAEAEVSSEDDSTCPDTRAKRQKLDSGLGGSPPAEASPPSPPSSAYEFDEDFTDIEEDDDEEEPSLPCPKASSTCGGADERCVRVSQLMRRGVAQLPLPPPLIRFINLDRDTKED